MFHGDPSLKGEKGDAERELHRGCPPEPAQLFAAGRLRLFVKPWHFLTARLVRSTGLSVGGRLPGDRTRPAGAVAAERRLCPARTGRAPRACGVGSRRGASRARVRGCPAPGTVLPAPSLGRAPARSRSRPGYPRGSVLEQHRPRRLRSRPYLLPQAGDLGAASATTEISPSPPINFKGGLVPQRPQPSTTDSSGLQRSEPLRVCVPHRSRARSSAGESANPAARPGCRRADGPCPVRPSVPPPASPGAFLCSGRGGWSRLAPGCTASGGAALICSSQREQTVPISLLPWTESSAPDGFGGGGGQSGGRLRRPRWCRHRRDAWMEAGGAGCAPGRPRRAPLPHTPPPPPSGHRGRRLPRGAGRAPHRLPPGHPPQRAPRVRSGAGAGGGRSGQGAALASRGRCSRRVTVGGGPRAPGRPVGAGGALPRWTRKGDAEAQGSGGTPRPVAPGASPLLDGCPLPWSSPRRPGDRGLRRERRRRAARRYRPGLAAHLLAGPGGGAPGSPGFARQHRRAGLPPRSRAGYFFLLQRAKNDGSPETTPSDPCVRERTSLASASQQCGAENAAVKPPFHFVPEATGLARESTTTRACGSPPAQCRSPPARPRPASPRPAQAPAAARTHLAPGPGDLSFSRNGAAAAASAFPPEEQPAAVGKRLPRPPCPLPSALAGRRRPGEACGGEDRGVAGFTFSLQLRGGSDAGPPRTPRARWCGARRRGPPGVRGRCPPREIPGGEEPVPAWSDPRVAPDKSSVRGNIPGCAGSGGVFSDLVLWHENERPAMTPPHIAAKRGWEGRGSALPKSCVHLGHSSETVAPKSLRNEPGWRQEPR
ncbi:collagen alpha-1(I) chain-like [Chroicocephalus ridibundus]|uniref:collagen alpha-1(I) chain-like n=1 Tax=Chroicocephalus ridibundus TaxID=1192867 RepID=UPI002FDD26E9